MVFRNVIWEEEVGAVNRVEFFLDRFERVLDLFLRPV